MSKIDALLITPPSRLEVYQGLSSEYAAIEPPVWSSLIANYLLKKNYNVQILDAEAENFSFDQTAEKILSINPKIAVFFLAIFSHLVHSDSNWTETGLMGITAAVIDACWYVSVAFFLTRANLIMVFRGKETAINKVSGMTLILIALYLLGVMLRGLL